MHVRPSGKFLIGILAGVLASLLISLGVIGVIAIGVLLLAVGIGRAYAILSGLLCGLGFTWLALGTNAAMICARTDDFCGRANYAPFLLIALGIAIAGVLIAATGLLRMRARTPA